MVLTHKCKIRVRYSETDQMGYVYYGNYAQFYEVGRGEMLRSIGISYPQMESDGVMMPVTELTCKYYKPARYDEEITIETTIEKLSGARIYFSYRLFNERQELLNIGTTTLVFVDMNTNRPVAVPDVVQAALHLK